MKINTINAIVYDIDGTLNKPDSFSWLKQQCGNKTIQLGYDPKDTSSPEQIAEQNKIARSPEFQQRMLDDPPAPWISHTKFEMDETEFDKIFGPQFVLLSSGRWQESIENTTIWIYNHISTKLYIPNKDTTYSFVGFTEYQKYLSEKKNAIMKWASHVISDVFKIKVELEGSKNILCHVKDRITFRLFDDCLDIVNWAKDVGFIVYLVKNGDLMEWSNKTNDWIPFQLKRGE
jgi:hypothetical protein